MAKPILLAVHDRPGDLERIEHELTSRYVADYDIISEDSPAAALARLDAVRDTPEAAVLALFAASEMTAMTGVEFLRRARDLHPHAQRVLLIPFSNRSASKPILRLIYQGRIDRYVTTPTRLPDENFRHLVTELLRDWQQQRSNRTTVVTIVDRQWAPRSHQIGDRPDWSRKSAVRSIYPNRSTPPRAARSQAAVPTGAAANRFAPTMPRVA